MNLEAEINAQQMFEYFNMLNAPTYVKLVKDFWVRAEVYDIDAAKVEELQAVASDPSLRGKTRKEMGLEPFRQTEIKSEASKPETSPASAPKRKRGKGESSIVKKAARSAAEFDWDAVAEAPKAKEVKLTGNEVLSSQFEVTPEMAKEADKIAAQLKEEQKKKKAEYRAAREAKLKSLGVDNSNEFLIQKAVEVQKITEEVQ